MSSKVEQSARLYRALRFRYGDVCHYCGVPFSAAIPWTLDHKVPASRGGLRVLGNLVLACGDCNAVKGDTPYDECDFVLIAERSLRAVERRALPYLERLAALGAYSPTTASSLPDPEETRPA